MKTIVANGFKRIVCIGLKKDDLLLESINKEIKRVNIKNGVLLSCIGTFSEATIHRVTTLLDEPTEEFITIKAPMELSCAQGIIADGVPHIHMVFSDLERTYSGHLENGCKILYLGELVIGELDGADLTRVKSEGYSLLDEKNGTH